jgi:hypothetical protein
MKRKESDLYEPVKRHFVGRGFTVRGEVLHCDLVALDSDDTVHIVELKLTCNLTVLLQAVARLNVSHFVYIAIPQPSKRQQPHWRELLKLCQLVGIGLLTVTFLRDGAFVTEQVPARRSEQRANQKKQAALVRETKARSGDYNIGGTNKTKRLTAYRQLALLCAHHIAVSGPSSPKQLRVALLQDKVSALLQANVYGWFERISKGMYGLTEMGQQALIEFDYVLREMLPVEYNESKG